MPPVVLKPSVGGSPTAPAVGRPDGAVGAGAARGERALRILRYALWFAVATFFVEIAMYLVELLTGPPQARGYVVNSVAKDSLFAALGLVALADLRGRLRLVGFIVFGHVVIVLTIFVGVVSGS